MPFVMVLAALPREIAKLVRGVAPDAAAKKRGVWLYRLPNAVVAAGGMGSARVSRAFEAALGCARPDVVISTGLAGSCGSAYLPGQVLEAGIVVDVRTGERFATGSASALVLASGDNIASTAEKGRLAAAYSAAMVDMEAAAVARLARAHGLLFQAVKGISDAHDFELASLARFATPQGQFRTGAFALHTALHPGTWRSAAELGRDSGRALAALQQRLQETLATPAGSASNPE